MTLNERNVGNVTLIDINGRVAVQDGADLFRQTIERIVAQGRSNVLLNFRGSPYIDSTALGEIVRAHATLSRQAGSLKLVNLTRPIRELFEVTNLLTIFEAFDDEAAAIASFTKPE